MLVFFPDDIKAFLVRFESDTVFNQLANDHLVAFWVVLHAILKYRHKCILAHHVEVNSIVSNQLHPDVTLGVADKARNINDMVKFPYSVIFFFVVLLFEEIHALAAPRDEALVINKVHLAQVKVGHFLILEVLWVFTVNSHSLALSVEQVAFLFILVVESLIGEVHLGAI